MVRSDVDAPTTAKPELVAARAALFDRRASALLDRVRSVLCEPTRSQIVRALRPGPLSVNDLAAVVRRTKWATSQHLRVLRHHGVVISRRQGRSVYYSLGDSAAARAADEALGVVASRAAAS